MGIRKWAKEEQASADAWNAKHPVGTPVRVMRDMGGRLVTKTSSEAWLLGGHTAVIQVEGISGSYALDRVTALEHPHAP
ncbi:MAG: hypothetical protein ACOZCK_04860 [Pseudomonadota bacterium]